MLLTLGYDALTSKLPSRGSEILCVLIHVGTHVDLSCFQTSDVLFVRFAASFSCLFSSSRLVQRVFKDSISPNKVKSLSSLAFISTSFADASQQWRPSSSFSVCDPFSRCLFRLVTLSFLWLLCSVGLFGRRKIEEPKQKPSKQGENQTATSSLLACDTGPESNEGHIVPRPSQLRHNVPAKIYFYFYYC